MIALSTLALTVMLALSASPATATPSVFVRDEAGVAWWSRRMEARILGQAAGPVTAQELSTYLERTIIYSPYRVCALEAVQADTYVGLDRSSQADIDAARPDATWRIEAVTPNGRTVVGQSVVFEACDEGDPRGAALLVTDKATGDILHWEPIGDRVRGERDTYPGWILFLSPKTGDELFGFASCAECGERTNVYYDVTRRKIYTEYNGH